MPRTTEEAKVALVAEDRFSTTFAAFQRQLAGSGSLIGGFTQRLGALGLSLGSLGAGLTFTAALAGIKAAADGLDALNDSADAVGDTVENLSALEDVARRNGGNLDLVTTSILKMNLALRETTEDSPASKALKALGLSAAELRRQAPTEALRQIGVALNGFANDGNKARIAQELFEKSLREIAPFLKDVAEAGQLTATATTAQAEAAERFNKALFGMQTEASNASRALVGPLLEAVNEQIRKFNEWRESGDKLMGVLRAIGSFSPLGQLAAGAAGLFGTTDAAEIARLTKLIGDYKAAQAKGDNRPALANDLALATQKLAALQKTGAASFRPSQNYGDAFKPSAADIGGKDKDKAGSAARQASEAERYLEALQKQGEKVQELTAFEQTLVDIQRGRIAGLTPALKQQILQESQRVDLARELNDEKEKELGMQKLIGESLARDADRTRALLADTTGGRAEKALADIARLRDALNDPAGDKSADFANRVLDAIDKIKEGLQEVPDVAKTNFDRMADLIERTMERSTDAVLDFLTGVKTDPKDLWRAFSADVLRAFIEDPIRAAMKQVRDEIFKALNSSGTGLSGLIGGLLGGLFGGSSSTLLPTAGGRASGGRVSAGGLYRVNENGIETFRPDVNGTILTAGQTRSRAAAAPVINNHITVNGDVSAQTVALLEAAMARNNAAVRRSMRTGGAFATS